MLTILINHVFFIFLFILTYFNKEKYQREYPLVGNIEEVPT